MVRTTRPRNTRSTIWYVTEPNSLVESGPTVPGPLRTKMIRIAITMALRSNISRRGRTRSVPSGFSRRAGLGRQCPKPGRQLRHDARPLGSVEIDPARDLVERAAAAEAKLARRVNDANLPARAFDGDYGAGHTVDRRDSRHHKRQIG